ncbi:hypothetical protein VWZ82_12870 [Phaeobacter sp. JH20_41]|uniref:hypothetical protein n=1 Tax=Phaeobacter sp. JH20_41 TaxID=3112498 RepID=UPI003A8C4F88
MTINHIEVVLTEDGIFKVVGGDADINAPLGTGDSEIAALADASINLSETAHPAQADVLIKLLEVAAAQSDLEGRNSFYVCGLRDAAKTIAGAMA